MSKEQPASTENKDNVIILTDVNYYRVLRQKLPNHNNNNGDSNNNNDKNNQSVKIEKTVSNSNTEVVRLNILNNINWTVKRGEHWILFGPNGAGKTSLLNILMGFLFPSNGKAVVLGEEIGRTDIWALQKRVSWVSSAIESRIYDEDPLLDIILSGAQTSTRLFFEAKEEDYKRADELMKSLNLEWLASTPWGVLSQGEKRKALIARSLMLDIEILILDEPCAGLDIGSREKFLGDLDEMIKNKPELTIIMVTHRVEEITDSFRNILVLKNGKVHKMGKISDIINKELLSELFSLPLTLKRQNNRYFCMNEDL